MARPPATFTTLDPHADETGHADRALEVHGCLAIGGPDLRCTTYPGGPTIVRDIQALFDDDGEAVELTRRVAAICRCGKSQLRPLCDGTHRFVPGSETDPAGGRAPDR